MRWHRYLFFLQLLNNAISLYLLNKPYLKYNNVFPSGKLFSAFGSKSYFEVLNLCEEITPYHVAYEYQKNLVNLKIKEKHRLSKLKGDLEGSNRNLDNRHAGYVLLLQHKHVYSLGSSATESQGPFRDIYDEENNKIEYDVIKSDRGGQITYHGPGQLIMYPIIDLVSIFLIK